MVPILRVGRDILSFESRSSEAGSGKLYEEVLRAAAFYIGTRTITRAIAVRPFGRRSDASSIWLTDRGTEAARAVRTGSPSVL